MHSRFSFHTLRGMAQMAGWARQLQQKMLLNCAGQCCILEGLAGKNI
jgi:hypothetical protein